MDRSGGPVVKKNLHVKCAITSVGEKDQYSLTPLGSIGSKCQFPYSEVSIRYQNG